MALSTPICVRCSSTMRVIVVMHTSAATMKKNSGKTTLVTKLIPLLAQRGCLVATVKHDGHDFEPDVPGTDSFRHRKAGAYGTAVFSDHRFLVTKECEGITEQELFLHFPEADIILVEGLKHSSYPKYVCGYPEKEADAAKIAEEILRLLEEKRRPCDKGDK